MRRANVINGRPNAIALNRSQSCDTYITVNYTNECEIIDDNYGVRCTYTPHYRVYTSCATISQEDIGGGVGGGSGRGEGENYSYPPDMAPPSPKNGPCEEARAMATKIRAALNDPKIDGHLNAFISKYKNSSKEYGFAIIKNVDGSYGFTATQGGQSENSINWSLDANANIVALIHVHPPGSSAVPSSTDVFGLAGFPGTDFAGSIVISGDDRYLVSITDRDKYLKFYAKKDKYYDVNTQSQWKYKSSIGRSFKEFSRDYMQMYPGQDAMFPTQLYLMQSFRMGVSLQKWEDTRFKTIRIDAQNNTSSGSITTIGAGGKLSILLIKASR